MERNLRTNYTQVDRVISHNNDESLTEQAHAPYLEIDNMVKNGGFHFSNKQALYGDMSDLPPLDHMLNNRLRLTQLHSQLKNNIKQHVPTVDSFVKLLKEGNDDDLIRVGLKQKPPEPVAEPDPSPAPAEPVPQ